MPGSGTGYAIPTLKGWAKACVTRSTPTGEPHWRGATRTGRRPNARMARGDDRWSLASWPARRAWSFSTFEPPLGGDVDPATLPDILFRQTQDAPSSAPARPRKEIKSRPFDPSTLDDRSAFAQLAGWLVAEYQERGGDDLKKVI